MNYADADGYLLRCHSYVVIYVDNYVGTVH
jgi:hypothetical protein